MALNPSNSSNLEQLALKGLIRSGSDYAANSTSHYWWRDWSVENSSLALWSRRCILWVCTPTPEAITRNCPRYNITWTSENTVSLSVACLDGIRYQLALWMHKMLTPELCMNKSAHSNLGRGPRRGVVAHVRRKVPIVYNGAPQIRLQKYPFPWTDPKTPIPASCLDPADIRCQTRIRSAAVFPQCTGQTDRPTDRPLESLTTIGRCATRATRGNNTVENDLIWIENDLIWISQGKLTTVHKWGGQMYHTTSYWCHIFSGLTHPQSLKSVNFWESYFENEKVDVFISRKPSESFSNNWINKSHRTYLCVVCRRRTSWLSL